jgi:hypothetical protein
MVMKKIVIFALISFLVCVVPAWAQAPNLVNYQGVLKDSGGNPLTGTYSITFSLYSVSSGGTALWTETQGSVSVSNGLFSVLLGSVTPLTPSEFSGTNRWLGVTVGGDPEMTPRQRIASVPYSLRSSDSGEYGDTVNNPALNCNNLLTTRPGIPSSIYWVKPTGASVPFQVYCDMVNDGGGWTLVWSNLRGSRGKVTTELQWGAAINTFPRVNGALSLNLESFEIYTGLAYWTGLATSSLLRYDWANDYDSAVDQRYRCTFSLNPATNYTISFSACAQLVGATAPGLVTYHGGRPFTTYDRDNDANAGNCSTYYSETPWWYGSCWSGNINGGGEYSESGYYNGAYWTSSATQWGNDAGDGAGNGWIYVK